MPMSLRWPVVCACLGAAVCASPPAIAQDSRVAVIAAEQAEKAQHLAPRRPNGLERTVLWVERELILTPRGFYPLFGSVYNGGGFAAGAGYRYYSGEKTHWDAVGLYSVKGYALAQLSADSSGHAGGRVDLRARAGYRDASQVWFHGVGLGTSSDDRTTFALTEAYGGAAVTVRPLRFAVVGAGISYEDFSVGEGGGRGPSTEDVFTPATAPGIEANPAFVHATASAGIDSRPARGYARHGSFVEARYHHYADRDDTYTFSRLDGEVVQHLPILRDTWVLSVRGLAQTTLNDDDVVPFFLLPSLGSGDTLRGFTAWRFRDRHSLLMSAEFRWTPNRNAMDMALFYDAGKVTSRRGDLNLEGLKSNVGIGVRFHGPSSTPLRIELARGNEGLRLVFAGSAAF